MAASSDTLGFPLPSGAPDTRVKFKVDFLIFFTAGHPFSSCQSGPVLVPLCEGPRVPGVYTTGTVRAPI